MTLEASGNVIYWVTLPVVMGILDEGLAGLGGFGIDAHHVYDPETHILFLGNGQRRQADSIGDVVSTVFHIGAAAEAAGLAVSSDGLIFYFDAADEQLHRLTPSGLDVPIGPRFPGSALRALAIGADGVIFAADRTQHCIRRFDPRAAEASVVLGTCGTAGSDGPTAATPIVPSAEALLAEPDGLAIGSDGSIYVADTSNDRLLRLRSGAFGSPLELLAGGTCASPDDSRPICRPAYRTSRVAVARDHTVYFQRYGDDRVPALGDNIAAIAPDGTFFIAMGGSPSTTQGGDGVPARCVDETDAVCARIGPVADIAIGPEDELCVATTATDAQEVIRCIRGPEGRVVSIAGVFRGGTGGFDYPDDSTPATRTTLAFIGRIAWSPDGRLYYREEILNDHIRVVGSSLEGGLSANHTVASGDGSMVYEFDPGGRHLRTLDSITGHELAHFEYAPGTMGDTREGQLVGIVDAEGRRLDITRSGSRITLTAPGGITTELALTDGRVTSVRDPASSEWLFSYHSTEDGLLATMTAPSTPLHTSQVHAFTYDSLGLLLTDADVRDDGVGAGPTQTLSEAVLPASRAVTLTSPESRETEFAFSVSDHGVHRLITRTNGYSVDTFQPSDGGDGTSAVSWGGAVTSVSSDWAPDPRFGGMDAPFAERMLLDRPDALGGEDPLDDVVARDVLVTRRRTTEPAGTDWTTLTSAVAIGLGTGDFATVLDRTDPDHVTSAWTPPSFRTDRGGTLTRDREGRVTRVELPGRYPVCIDYIGSSHRPSAIRQSLDCTAFGDVRERHASITYADSSDPNGARWLTSLTYGGRTATVTPDARGWASRVALPGRTSPLAVDYDAHGDVTSLTPPGRSAHAFTYTGRDLPDTYTPPSTTGASAAAGPLVVDTTYGDDGHAASVTLRDGRTVGILLRTDGNLDRVDGSDARYDVRMEGGRLGGDAVDDPTVSAVPLAIDGPGGSYGMGWDGPFLTQEAWGRAASAGVDGSLVRTVDGRALLTRELAEIGGRAQTVSYRWDSDRVLDQVGIVGAESMSIETYAVTATAEAGEESLSVTTIVDGGLTSTATGSPFGEAVRMTTGLGGETLFEDHVCTRGADGRITQREESWRDAAGGALVTRVYAYAYDAAGRLSRYDELDGTCDAVGARRGLTMWTYSEAGIRSDLSANEADQVESGGRVYNGVGQLSQRGARTFGYDVFGMLRTTTQAGVTTTYDWDGMGRLIAIRPAPVSAATPEQRFIYRDALEPVAWTRFDGASTDTGWFVYGTQPHVPDLMVLDRGSDGSLEATYRYLTDERGSVRRLVDVVTGAVVQSIEYDAWGVATFGGGETAQPFGFTGAIWLGAPALWHMGARDYDPSIGRWTALDPIGFAGGVNLYAYCAGDPVDRIDPAGRWEWGVGGQFGGAIIPGTGISGGVNVEYTSSEGWNFYSYTNENFFDNSDTKGVDIGGGGGVNIAFSPTDGDSWSGFFESLNGSVGVGSGSFFWSPEGGASNWIGLGCGIGVGLPLGASYRREDYVPYF